LPTGTVVDRSSERAGRGKFDASEDELEEMVWKMALGEVDRAKAAGFFRRWIGSEI
jgi:hypothetical protein